MTGIIPIEDIRKMLQEKNVERNGYIQKQIELAKTVTLTDYNSMERADKGLLFPDAETELKKMISDIPEECNDRKEYFKKILPYETVKKIRPLMDKEFKITIEIRQLEELLNKY